MRWKSRGWAFWLTAIASLGSSCRDAGPPTVPAPPCRSYALAYEENGTPFSCDFQSGASPTLSCASGASMRRSGYASLSDFVREPATPHRLRVTTRETTGGLLLASFTRTVRSYEYDAQGRLTRRTRTSHSSLGTFVLDETRYSAWDASSRPIRGEIQAGSTSAPLSLTYDDGSRVLETTQGERVELDANGNLAHEIEAFGLGADIFRVERRYRVTATARVCLP